MGKNKRIGKRLKAFVDRLSPEEAREQLVLAYLQMEKCIRVLRGHDVEPVEMLDNGRQTDLELFYRCKKVRAELDMAEKGEYYIDNIRKALRKYENAPFKLGDEVWYSQDKYPCRSKIASMQYDINDGWEIQTENGKVFSGFKGLYKSFNELVDILDEKNYWKVMEEFLNYGKQ